MESRESRKRHRLPATRTSMAVQQRSMLEVRWHAVPDQGRKRIATFIEPFRVDPGSKVTLERDFDPAFKAGNKKKKHGAKLLRDGVELLTHYPTRLADP